MANNFKRTNLAVTSEADAVCALLDSGFLDIYDGSQPASADAAVTTQTKLARLTFGSPAFGAAVNGVATAHAIAPDSAADATGTASWFRAMKADGVTKVFDGSAGTSGCDLILDSTSIAQNAEVSVSSMTYTGNKG
jgi:hypothetical protein